MDARLPMSLGRVTLLAGGLVACAEGATDTLNAASFSGSGADATQAGTDEADAETVDGEADTALDAEADAEADADLGETTSDDRTEATTEADDDPDTTDGAETSDDADDSADEGAPGPGSKTFVYQSADGVLIPNGQYDGNKASMGCASLEVDVNKILAKVTVQVGITHGRVGELVARVYVPSGAYTTIFSRPGYNEPSDDGFNPDQGGIARQVKWQYPLDFADDEVVDAEMMGSGLTTNQTVCQQDGICAYRPNSGAGLGTGLTADFAGSAHPGIWELCVGDVRVQANTGRIHGFRVTVEWD